MKEPPFTGDIFDEKNIFTTPHQPLIIYFLDPALILHISLFILILSEIDKKSFFFVWYLLEITQFYNSGYTAVI